MNPGRTHTHARAHGSSVSVNLEPWREQLVDVSGDAQDVETNEANMDQ